MSLSTDTKLSYLFKALRNREFSTIAKQYYEEVAGIGIISHSDWIFADTIPGTPPGATNSIIKVHTDAADGALKLVQDVSVGGLRGWYAEDPASTRVGSFVSPIFGQNYLVKIYQDDGTGTAKGSRIYDTAPEGFLFNYATGYLSIQETHAYNTPFWIEAYRYIGNSVSDAFVNSSPIFDDTFASGSVLGSSHWEKQINIGSIKSGLFQLVFCQMTTGNTTDNVIELYDGDPGGGGVLIYQTPSVDLSSANHVDPNVWWGECQATGALWARVYNNGASAAEYSFRVRILGDSSTPFGEP